MNRIRSLREEVGLTQKELATRLGLRSGAVISKYENSITPLPEEALRILSMTFNVSVDYILGLSDDRKKGASVANQYMNWDAFALVDSADALDERERQLIIACTKTPALIEVITKYNNLSSRSKRKAIEYLEMLKAVEESQTSEENA